MTPNLISVALFSNELSLGGAEQHILTLLRGLDRSCFRLQLICAPELAAQINEMVPADVTLIPLELRRATQLSAATRLGHVLKSRRVDILHSHLFYASLFASPIGKLCGVPVVVETPHDRRRIGTRSCSSHWAPLHRQVVRQGHAGRESCLLRSRLCFPLATGTDCVI